MPSAAQKKTRPKYLSLPAIIFEIRLPVPGWVSLLHRVSGALLFFPFTAWLLYMLDRSLASEQGFVYIRDQYLASPLVRLGLLAMVWAYCHHFFAGIRFLFLDLHRGIDLRSARRTAVIVLLASLGLTLLVGARLW
jgi:succinate dehydrogenase / fumarate reductase, cytochrome b subunit